MQPYNWRDDSYSWWEAGNGVFVDFLAEMRAADIARENKLLFWEYVRSIRPLILRGVLFVKRITTIPAVVYCRAYSLIGAFQDRQRRARRKRMLRLMEVA